MIRNYRTETYAHGSKAPQLDSGYATPMDAMTVVAGAYERIGHYGSDARVECRDADTNALQWVIVIA